MAKDKQTNILGYVPEVEEDIKIIKTVCKIGGLTEDKIKEEIRTTMTILYELSKIRKKYMGVAEEEQMSWADIRQEIQHKMKNSFCM